MNKNEKKLYYIFEKPYFNCLTTKNYEYFGTLTNAKKFATRHGWFLGTTLIIEDEYGLCYCYKEDGTWKNYAYFD